ncbi:MAG: hypothetical protein H6684_14170 [Deltaproteobacteria bacterium]|nr:hypothetical protein [Deltaproteobacteria bacterium]
MPIGPIKTAILLFSAKSAVTCRNMISILLALSVIACNSGSRWQRESHTEKFADIERSATYSEISYEHLREIIYRTNSHKAYMELARRGGAKSVGILRDVLIQKIPKDGFSTWTLRAVEASRALAIMAKNGDPAAIEFLKQAVDWRYWTSNVDIDSLFSEAMIEPGNFFVGPFVEPLMLAKDDTIREYLTKLYAEHVKASPPVVPNGALDEGLEKYIRQDAIGSKYFPKEDEDIAKKYINGVWLNPKLPNTVRCVRMWPRKSAHYYHEFKELLNNVHRKSNWALVIRGIGLCAAYNSGVNSQEVFEELKFFLESRFSGPVDKETANALLEVPITLALSDLDSLDEYKKYMREGMRPSVWKDRTSWTFPGMSLPESQVVLAQQFVKAFLLSGESLPSFEEERSKIETTLSDLPFEIRSEYSKAYDKAIMLNQKSDSRLNICRRFSLKAQANRDYWNYPY